MLELNELNFEQEIAKHPKVVVMFWREGCPACKTMKPRFEKHEAQGYEKALYDIADAPDSITDKYPVNAVPCFYTFIDGKAVGMFEGVLAKREIDFLLTPEKLPQKPIAIEKASMLTLLTDEANLIDKVAPLMAQLKKIQKEMARRKDLSTGKDACCDSCAEGKSCEGGCKA